MATIKDRLKKIADIYNAELEDDNYSWWVWLRDSKLEWKEGNTPVLVQEYCNDSQSWKLDAFQDLVERMAEGYQVKEENNSKKLDITLDIVDN